jgi:hypothetical protein
MNQRAAFTDRKRRAWIVEEADVAGVPALSITCDGIGFMVKRDLANAELAARSLVRCVGQKRAAARRITKARKAHLHDQLARELGRGK